MQAGWLLYGDEEYRQAAEHLAENVPVSFFSVPDGRYAWGRYDDGTLATGPAGFSGVFSQGYLAWVFGKKPESQTAYEWLKSCEQADGRLVCFDDDPAYTLTAVLFSLAADSLGETEDDSTLTWVVSRTYDPADGGVRDTGIPTSTKFSNVAGFTAAAFLESPAFKSSGPTLAQGDLDGNGTLDITDVIHCLRMIVGEEPINLTRMDMNGDNRGDITDVILILHESLS
jgi:hypothetical protein